MSDNISSYHIRSDQLLLPHQVRSAFTTSGQISLYHIRSDQLMSAYITSGQISWCQLISYKVRPADVSLYHIKSDQLMSAYNTSGQITWLSAYIASSMISWSPSNSQLTPHNPNPVLLLVVSAPWPHLLHYYILVITIPCVQLPHDL